MGTVIFCEGGVVVLRKPNGTCDSGPICKIARHGPVSAGLMATDQGAAPVPMFQQPLQIGNPLHIMGFLERLKRLSNDACTVADDDQQLIVIEGRVLDVGDRGLVQEVTKKLGECEELILDMINQGVETQMVDEWNGSAPVTPLFQTERRVVSTGVAPESQGSRLMARRVRKAEVTDEPVAATGKDLVPAT